MNIERILATYDAMFGKNSLEEIENYLVQVIAQAKDKISQGEPAQGILFTMLNEIIGFFRDTTQKEKALKYCDELFKLLKTMQLQGSFEYATALLNIANAYRAFDLHEQALQLFETVEVIYRSKLNEKDFYFASLYNNWSLLYQEMQAFEKARDMLLKALQIVDSHESAMIPQATTRTNLAATLLQIGSDQAYREAIFYLREALDIFEADGGRDFHYGAALVAMGDACSYKKNYEEAVKYYEAGLKEIEKHTGKNDNYARVLEKYHFAAKYASGAIQKSNLERCRVFYEQHGREMIHRHFPTYEERIAVGLVGEGSDCFGFDDEISTDHDYGLGFCMWLTSEDYEKIGETLQAEYNKLMEKFAPQGANDRFLQSRRGVFKVNLFFNQLLETDCDFEKNRTEDCRKVVERVNEFQLAAATNGTVFADSLGVFSAVRGTLLEYYPEKVRKYKLAQAMHEFSQYAQSNYPRMMARNDRVTALICIGKAMEAAFDLTYLLEKRYAPYYKWKKKGLEKLAAEGCALPGKVLPLIEKIAVLPLQVDAWKNVKYSAETINLKDECVCTFEEIAGLILEELKKQKLVKTMPAAQDVFLEGYISQLENMNYVEKIVELEWKQFDQVKNEGGRADCQDNWGTFSIMRKSQYLAWPDELLESFYHDLLVAESEGWNLITEKYARMMESTAPERYKELEKNLPVRSEERLAIQEEIIKIQVAWMEEFAAKFPKMAGNARSIRTSEDTAFNTSYETYLRGEMGTYSENTFVLYGRFIVGLLSENRNLAYEIMDNTAKLYGYASVQDAEEQL